MNTKIEFGDIVRVVRIVRTKPGKNGQIVNDYEEIFNGVTGVWEPCQDNDYDGKINGYCFMLGDLDLVKKADGVKPEDKPKQICVPIGTLVNGIPIEKHAALQAKVADLTLELDALKNGMELKKELTQPEIPDWIKKGKWVKIAGMLDPLKIKSITDEYVYYTNWVYNTIEYVTKYGKPFTPPPCPELPKCCHYISLYGGAVHLLADVFEMESEMDAIKEYRDWKIKWGD